ncbi:MAG: hypothetical protein NTV22_00765 [bacterium]|nr:hypothetical protein [bacterium]
MKKTMKNVMLVSVWLVVAAIFGCAMVLYFWTGSETGTQDNPQVSRSALQAPRTEPVEVVLKRQLGITATCHSNNEQAVKEAIKGVNELFDDMKARVPAFVEDIYGIKTKLKIIGKGTCDLWPWQKNRSRVKSLIEKKFAEHVITAAQLLGRINAISCGFTTSLTENKNRLALSVTSNLADALPQQMAVDTEIIRAAMNREIDRSVKPLLINNLGGEAASIVIAEVSAAIAINIFSRAMSQASVSIATETAATCSAAALSGWATFGIGLIVAVVVDYFVSHYAKDKMTAALNERIEQMSKVVLDGVDGKPGYTAMLDDVTKAINIAEWHAVSNSVVACYSSL